MSSFRSLRVATGLFIAGIACTAQASEFRTMGVRALSMGGAAVACPAPAYAAYYNPAALGLDDRSAIDISLGLGVGDTGIAEHLDPLTAYDWNAAIANPQGSEATAIIAELKKIKSTDALMIKPDAAVAMRLYHLASGVYGSAQFVVYANLDLTHMNQTGLSDPNSFAFNSSELFLKGLGLVEVPLAYGTSFKVGDSGTLCVGGALKYIEGATYDVRQGVFITSNSDQIRDRLENADKMSSGFGVDLGILYRTLEDRLSIGLLARNLNSPKFETVTGDSFAEDAQLRAGAAYKVSEHIIAALDVDLTSNKTLVTGFNSRQVSAGIGYEARIFAVRGGVTKDIEADGSPVVWSLGTSLGDEALHLDLAASVSGSSQTYDKFTIPSEGSFMVALGGGW